MVEIRLQDFKCFKDTGFISLKPITFLVGENSSGKTSFLAALRLLLELFSAPTGNLFNRDPYFLGGFDQIAHNNAGGRKRASSFRLSLSHNLGARRPATKQRSSRPLGAGAPAQIFHTMSFEKGTPQPQLTSYTFGLPAHSTRVLLNEANPRITLDDVEMPLESELVVPPADLIRANPSYLRYVFEEFLLGGRSRERSPAFKQNAWSQLEAIASSFRSSARFLSRRVFASSPVRSEPLRTYNPSEVGANAQGSHVPLELAVRKARSSEEWARIRNALAAFGKRAGLFDDIDVRQLGTKDGDPFQIEVRVGGPLVNIVDVGYGVSQALPIIYQIQNSFSYDAFLIQQPEVHLHPRAQAELGSLLVTTRSEGHSPLYVIETHSDYIVDRVRIEVQRARIRPEDVGILYFYRHGKDARIAQISLDSVGNLVDPPDGFRDFFLEEHRNILGL